MIKQLSDGWFVPEYEGYLQDVLNREKWLSISHYQRDRLEKAYPCCRKFDVAVDIGANIGIFSYNMAMKFKQVIAFEPIKELWSCFYRNIRPYDQKIKLHKCALGAEEKKVQIEKHAQSCVSHFVSDLPGDFPVATLDSFQLQACDLIKIDVEGYEYFVIQGALETIKKYRPVIILEEKNFNSLDRPKDEFSALKIRPQIPLYAARRLIEDLGYNLLARMGHDFILNPLL